MEIKWKVQDAPTGAYRSFFNRNWPTADLEDGRTAFSLNCEDSYVPKKVKTGDHAEIKIHVAVWNEKPGTFVWKRLKKTAKTLAEAKQICDSFLKESPETFQRIEK